MQRASPFSAARGGDALFPNDWGGLVINTKLPYIQQYDLFDNITLK